MKNSDIKGDVPVLDRSSSKPLWWLRQAGVALGTFLLVLMPNIAAGAHSSNVLNEVQEREHVVRSIVGNNEHAPIAVLDCSLSNETRCTDIGANLGAGCSGLPPHLLKLFVDRLVGMLHRGKLKIGDDGEHGSEEGNKECKPIAWCIPPSRSPFNEANFISPTSPIKSEAGGSLFFYLSLTFLRKICFASGCALLILSLVLMSIHSVEEFSALPFVTGLLLVLFACALTPFDHRSKNVLRATSDESFVNLNDAAKLFFGLDQRGTDFVGHQPSPVVATFVKYIIPRISL